MFNEISVYHMIFSGLWSYLLYKHKNSRHLSFCIQDTPSSLKLFYTIIHNIVLNIFWWFGRISVLKCKIVEIMIQVQNGQIKWKFKLILGAMPFYLERSDHIYIINLDTDALCRFGTKRHAVLWSAFKNHRFYFLFYMDFQINSFFLKKIRKTDIHFQNWWMSLNVQQNQWLRHDIFWTVIISTI